jgi:hypothetical protein
MWQQWMIALLVVLAAGYVIWTFLSLRARQALLDVMAARGVLVGFAVRHRARMTTPGCGNCSAADATGRHARKGA